jgi:SAM-dependent methyltransferase
MFEGTIGSAAAAAARRSSARDSGSTGLLARLARLRADLTRTLRFRLHARHCTLCGWHGKAFQPFGNQRQYRLDAFCPGCQSVERHRLAYLLLRDRLGTGHRTLHVAPEPGIKPWLKRVSADYLSVGLGEHVMRPMDLTRLDLPDRCKSLVWCSHVLEHIEADRAAIGEIFRVLEPGGVAILQVPIDGPTTYEDSRIRDEAGRLAAFHQVDHVRVYGLDLADRLKAAGFEVEILSAYDLPERLVRRHALARPMTNEVFVCRKPQL